MGAYISYEKDKLDSLFSTLKTRIPGASVVILKELMWYANWEAGFYHGFPIERGEVCISEKRVSGLTNYGRKTIRNAISVLIQENQIVLKGTIEGAYNTKVYRIVNYDSFVHKPEQGATEGANKGPTRGQQGATSYGFKDFKDVKELESKSLSAEADRQANLPESKPARKKNPPTDPMLNCNIFLRRAEAEGLVPTWVRDGKIVKEILAQRRRQGIEDPQAEAWAMWESFLLIPTDANSPVFTMRGRAHDIPAFRQHYQWLLENAHQANGNGKAHHPAPVPKRRTAMDVVAEWNAEIDREEAERDKKGV